MTRVLLNQIYIYSQLSAKGLSRKRTAPLYAFSNPHFTSQSNFVFTHSHKRTLSRKRTRTLLKMRLGVLFCLRSFVSGHPMYNNCLLAMKFVFNLQYINKNTLLFDRAIEQWGSVLSSLLSTGICYF